MIHTAEITSPEAACFDIADARFVAYDQGWTDTATPFGLRHADGRRARLTTNLSGDWFVKVW